MSKIRTCFVANSSSSSFIVSLDKISPLQRDMICDHIEVATRMFPEEFYTNVYDHWRIYVDENNIKMETDMDNFDMYEFLLKIGINNDDIIMGDY